ncbi:MAG: aspartyl protease family protein [Desulfuromonadales bacterium]
MFSTALICTIFLIMPLASLAGIYKYRDANGRLNFVDDTSKVPPQFRDNLTSMTEATDSPVVYDERDDGQQPAEATLSKQKETDSAAVKKKLRKYQTPVEIRGNRVLVPVEVAMGNRVAQLSLLLDTGATTTVLHRGSLTGLDLPSGRSFKARVAGGATVNSERIRFRHIDIGPFHEEKVYAMVINLQGQELSFDGMLGMDFLKAHPYQIDFQNQLIIWEPVD